MLTDVFLHFFHDISNLFVLFFCLVFLVFRTLKNFAMFYILVLSESIYKGLFLGSPSSSPLLYSNAVTLCHWSSTSSVRLWQMPLDLTTIYFMMTKKNTSQEKRFPHSSCKEHKHNCNDHLLCSLRKKSDSVFRIGFKRNAEIQQGMHSLNKK